MIDFASKVCYTLKYGGGYMSGQADIIRDSINEFSRIQDWMMLAKKNNDLETYDEMYKRCIELKVILSSLGVNITELDRIKE